MNAKHCDWCDKRSDIISPRTKLVPAGWVTLEARRIEDGGYGRRLLVGEFCSVRCATAALAATETA